jgi:hypothetical protein
VPELASSPWYRGADAHPDGFLTRRGQCRLHLALPDHARGIVGGPTGHGTLILPSILKAGFIVGAQYGNGELRKGGQTMGTTT